MKSRSWSAVMAFGLFLSACALAPGAAPTETQATAPSATATDTVVPPTPTATFTPTQTPFIPFQAVSTVNGLNLRTGPGYLFPILKSLPQGSYLIVSGRSRGGEWFYVYAPDNSAGWVFGQLINATHNLQEVPVVEPENVQLIRGRVRDAQGTLIQGVVFNVVRSLQQNTPSNTVVSDAGGEIFSFMPAETTGTWVVVHVGIACKSNVWKGPDCADYKEGYTGKVEPLYVEVRLPFESMLEFTWK